jgi:hypothetical protein
MSSSTPTKFFAGAETLASVAIIHLSHFTWDLLPETTHRLSAWICFATNTALETDDEKLWPSSMMIRSQCSFLNGDSYALSAVMQLQSGMRVDPM